MYFQSMKFYMNFFNLNYLMFEFLYYYIMYNRIIILYSFFFSAVLISYGVMKMKQKRIDIGLYIFRRIWRYSLIIIIWNDN